jgi:hypothetical protein
LEDEGDGVYNNHHDGNGTAIQPHLIQCASAAHYLIIIIIIIIIITTNAITTTTTTTTTTTITTDTDTITITINTDTTATNTNTTAIHNMTQQSALIMGRIDDNRITAH